MRKPICIEMQAGQSVVTDWYVGYWRWGICFAFIREVEAQFYRVL